MKTKFTNSIMAALPLLLFTVLLVGLLLIRLLFNMVLPAWGAWVLGLAWAAMVFDYLVRSELFKQIGGFAVVLIALAILTGALVPKERVARYPQVTSGQIVDKMESSWNAVYSGNIFKTYSLKQQLIHYGQSLENLDPFRHGKMILYALLGFSLAVVYLFPLEPSRRGGRCEKWNAGRRKLNDRGRSEAGGRCGKRDVKRRPSDPFETNISHPTSHIPHSTSHILHPTSHDSQKNSSAAYAARFALLFLAGALFAAHVELLQVLSPTRLVTLRSVVDSSTGLLLGLLLFIPLQIFYIWLAHFRSKGSARFNVIGVGVDAVSMADCLRRFEEIIEGDSLATKERTDRKEGGRKQEIFTTRFARGSQSNNRGEGEVGSASKTTDFGIPKSEQGTSNVEGLKPASGSESSPVRREDKDKSDSDNLQPTTYNSHPMPAMTSALGVAGIIEARRNQKLQRILNESVLNTPDGMPLVWLGKLFGYRNIDRVYGPDLLRDACAYGESRGWKHFFYGAAPGIVEKLQEKLEEKHPDIQISGIYCPPFRDLTPEEEAEVVERVNRSGTDIFWIGISTPKQLYFMDHIRSKLNCKIICPVGYAFDVNAGVQQDAPDWAKVSGFQWLHRAIKQPRLWKRYLPDNPRFLFEVMLQILHLKRYPMLVHERVRKPYLDTEGYPRFPAGVVSLSAMSLEGARDRVLHWVQTGQKHYVNICTADTMVQCFDRPDMAKIVKHAGMATTDGMPLVWLARHYGFANATRVYGPDLMLALCAATSGSGDVGECGSVGVCEATSWSVEGGTLDVECEGVGSVEGGKWKVESEESHPTSNIQHPTTEKKCISHFFYGATDEVLSQLKTNLLKKFPDLQIAGMYSPPFRPLTDSEKDDVTEMINASGADIVWCGLGTPKQDYWVAEFRPRLHCAAILAVGAAFDFHAGHVRQAPRWMMKSGLEWLFRLSVEPKRLWRRYVIGNPRFVLLIWRQFLSKR